jgi:hypothetical protein
MEEQFDRLKNNKIVRVSFIIAVSIGGLYIMSKAFKVIENTVLSFKDMKDAFKK